MPSSSWNMASDSSLSACFEAQSFNNFGAEPHTNFINNLYVYPLMLKYDNQKVFNKARNIACSIRFVSFEGQNEKISEVNAFYSCCFHLFFPFLLYFYTIYNIFNISILGNL